MITYKKPDGKLSKLACGAGTAAGQGGRARAGAGISGHEARGGRRDPVFGRARPEKRQVGDRQGPEGPKNAAADGVSAAAFPMARPTGPASRYFPSLNLGSSLGLPGCV